MTPDRPAPPTRSVLGRFHLTDAPLRGPPQQLTALWRGAVASLFPAETAFHGHEGAHTVARFPEVHYRWINAAPALFAIGPAAEQAMAHPWPNTTVRIGDQERTIQQVEWTVAALHQSFSRRLLRYELGAPWIALNQENHARYRTLDSTAQRAELDRILVGNLLTMSKAFGWFYTPEETIYAAFEPRLDVPCMVKGNREDRVRRRRGHPGEVQQRHPPASPQGARSEEAGGNAAARHSPARRRLSDARLIQS